MKKELTLYISQEDFGIELAPVNGRDIMDYLDDKYERLLHKHIEEMKILAQGGCYDRL